MIQGFLLIYGDQYGRPVVLNFQLTWIEWIIGIESILKQNNESVQFSSFEWEWNMNLNLIMHIFYLDFQKPDHRWPHSLVEASAQL